MIQNNHASQEPTRQSLRGTDVNAWLNTCAPQSTYLQQAQPQAHKRTCAELGVCQNRKVPCLGCTPSQPASKPAKPRTQWIFEVMFEKRDLIFAAIVIAIAYIAARS